MSAGRRVHANADGELWLAPGDFGMDPGDGHWKARCPDPEVGMGDLCNHEVTEHEDGTITVAPSILITGYEGDCKVQWHGYLERGIWRQA